MDGSAQTTPRRATCIFWHERGYEPPCKLRQAIAAKQLREVDVVDPFGALAEVCRARNDETSDRAVLLLIEPASLAGAGTVSRMVERYAPSAAVWVFEEAASPQLRALSAEDVQRWEELAATGTSPAPIPLAPPSARPVVAGPSLSFEGEARSEPRAIPRPSIRRGNLSRPRLRLAGDGTLPQDDSPTDAVHVREPGRTKEAGEPVPTRAILSDAELAMLLADGPESNEQ